MRRLSFLAFALVGCSLQTNGLGTSTTFETTNVDSGIADGADDVVSPMPDSFSPPPDSVEPEFDTAIADTAVEEADADVGVMLSGCAPASFGPHKYLFCERDANWEEARTTCQFAGLDLAVIDDAAENDFLTKAIAPASSSDFYIGLNDQVKEGDYVWVDGTKPGYTHWAPLEPNDFFGEDCSIIQKDGTWNDVDCTSSPSNAFICESK
ncbi:MAG: C-type lectin domain-containing protein [Polyangiales bacterium]